MDNFFLSKNDFINKCECAFTVLDYVESVKRGLWYFDKCQKTFENGNGVYNCYFYNTENAETLLLICTVHEGDKYDIKVQYLSGH